MASTSDISKGMTVMYNNEPHIVIDKEFYAPAKGASFHRVKIKSIRSGKIIGITVKSGERLEELLTETKTMQFLYSDEKNAYFMDPVSFEQIDVTLEQIPGGTDFLHTEGKYILIIFEGKAISVQLPNKLSLEVKETGSGVKGNTATNATKEATLETGLVIQVPLFIKQGEKVIINTETVSYVGKDS